MNSLVKSRGRIAKHLPNKTLDDPLNRITVDDRGRVWVTEDTTLVVLKGSEFVGAGPRRSALQQGRRHSRGGDFGGGCAGSSSLSFFR